MRALVSISVIVSCVYLALVATHHATGSPLAVVLKVASIGLLVAVAVIANHRRKLLIVALSFSVLGDLLLELRRIGPFGPEQLFLFGLVSFLTAHIFYIAMFLRSRVATFIFFGKSRAVACVAALVA